MKPIKRADLVKLGKTGAAIADLKSIFNLNDIDEDIDDRDPLDRIADELIKLTYIVQSTSHAQSKEVIVILNLLLDAINKIDTKKQEVEIKDTRPKAWDVHVKSRTEQGRIESIRMVAGN